MTNASSPDQNLHGLVSEDITISQVHLRITDGERSGSFYTGLLGFRQVRKTGNELLLSSTGLDPTQIVLTIDASPVPKPAGTTGLYHIAILYPHREALAQVVRRLIEHEYPLQGASDHGVSEAVYLADPDGNGVELYVDRPREVWPRQNGSVAMMTEPLDLDDLLRTAERKPPSIDGVHIGHIHLQVSDLKRSEEFYHIALGFDVTQRSYPGALFLSRNGYHHHIGLNTWGTRGASRPPPNAVGLVSFSVTVAARGWSEIGDRLEREQRNPGHRDNMIEGTMIRLSDPDGHVVLLRRSS